MRRRPATVLALSVVFLGSGCSAPGAVEFSPIGSGGVSSQQGNFFELSLCGNKPDPFDVTIVEVQATTYEGSDQPLEFLVLWAGEGETASSASDPLLDAYEDADGATGAVGGCKDGDAAHLAVVMPEATDERIVVGGIELTYESDGEERTITSSGRNIQYPEGKP
jgi:hypothetical protein